MKMGSLEELGHERLRRYPMPIAVEWAQVIKPGQSIIGRHGHFQSLIDGTMRYCALIMLNNYKLDSHRLWGPEPKEQLGEFSKQLEATLIDIEVPSCFQLLKALTRVYGKSEDRYDLLFMPELYDFLWDTEGNLTQGQQDWEKLVKNYMPLGADEDFLARHYASQAPLLAGILKELEFLCDYPLLWIERSEQKSGKVSGECIVQPLMGLDWKEVASKRWQEVSWEKDRLLLGNPHEERFLQLHPFLILRHCEQCEKEGIKPPYEVFLYDREETLDAIWVGRWSTVEEQRRPHRHPESGDIVKREITKIIVELEIKGKPLTVSWQEAVENGHDFSCGEVLKLSSKYNSDLYIPREEVEGQAKRFLREEGPTGFVVVGNSGVGKTNLLCHLADWEIEERPDDIVLFFSCAQLCAGENLEDLIATQLLLEEGLTLTEVLRELDDQRPTTDSRLVVLFDALNEHPAPIPFLKAINDQIVMKYRRYPWLKVIVSCRSELWRLLELERFPNPYLFYQVGGKLDVRLDTFSKNELPRVYELYRTKFRLKPPFDKLSDQALNFVQDPLMLRFVAEAYYEQEIPGDVQSLRVFRKYVAEKIGSDTDEQLGMDRLVQLMHEGKTDALDVADLRRDEQIGQWVMAPRQEKTTAHRSPYVILLDRGVLYETIATEGLYRKEQVRFTYDRLFEYLLAETALPPSLGQDEVLRLVREARDYPSLWGALKARLGMAFDTRLLTRLASLDVSGIPGLLLDTLAFTGQERRQDTAKFLGRLLKGDSQSGRLLAILAAYELGDTSVLKDAVDNRDAYTRAMGVQYTYYLWERDHSIGEKLIREIVSDIGGLKTKQALRSYVELSGYLGTHMMGELEEVTPFLLLWRDIFRKFGLAASDKQSLIGKAKDSMRGLIIEVGARLLMEGWRALGERGGLMNYDTLTKFFELPQDLRKRVGNVARYIDPDIPGFDSVTGDVLALAQIPDAMIGFMLLPLLICQSLKDRERGIGLMDDIFNTNVPIAQYTAQKALAALLTPMVMQADPDPELDALIKRFEEYQMRTWVDPNCTITILNRTYPLGAGHVFYVLLFESIRHPGSTRAVDEFLQTLSPTPAIEMPDTDLESANIIFMIKRLGDIGMLGAEGRARAVLPIFECWLDHPSVQVRRSLTETLALLRGRAPQLVDMRLTSWGSSEQRKTRIRELEAEMKRNPPMESAGTRFGRSGLMSMQSFPFLQGAPPYIASAVSRIAIEAQDFPSATRIIVETILEAARQRVTEAPPSR